ncbi:hypothetical protein FXO38_24118 [Capsicum annuum]|uniref:MADS-box domain-containing protein n=1 Tax=Capsicum annuum TaxID=4072 RepID=A0A2G2Y047_CAPAN|nr:hypothetical protein FXO38_24118 [Capsicum annuum]KAF3666252.1 hypothetical protein FXO37_10640 [Capsicum annuum]PHT63123.1 hypothetical protein T459_33038 [Capsicum annuum]
MVVRSLFFPHAVVVYNTGSGSGHMDATRESGSDDYNRPYHDEPKVFPNHDATINTFTKFRELSMLEKSNNMMTHEEFNKKRIKKMEKQLYKERKKNRIIELTNKMYEMLNGKGTPADMHSYDLNDLSYVINQNVKQVQEAIKTKVDVEGSTSNAPQHIDGLTVPDRTNSEWRRDLLSAPAGAPVSMASLMTTSSKILSGTNSEGTRAPLLVPVMASVSMVPPVAPSMIPSTAPSQVAQSMSHLIATCPQIVPSEGPSWVSPSPHLPLSFSSQTHPPIPLQIDLQRPPHGMAPSIPLSMMAPPMFPSINTPQISTSMPMNNYQNSSIDFPQNPGLSPDMLDWNNDDIMTLFDDSSFSIINVQEPNGDNNF